MTKYYPQWGFNPGLWLTSHFNSNTLLSELIWHVLLRGSLNFCLCITWFLDLDDLAGINRAWLYKEPKVSVLQANDQLPALCITGKLEWLLFIQNEYIPKSCTTMILLFLKLVNFWWTHSVVFSISFLWPSRYLRHKQTSSFKNCFKFYFKKLKIKFPWRPHTPVANFWILRPPCYIFTSNV